MGNGVSLVPQVQGVYQRIEIDGFTDTGGSTYAFSNNDSLVGR
jgi:outer membrane autotransporter protein